MLQITHVLPRSAWASVKVFDNKNPLIDVTEIPHLTLTRDTSSKINFKLRLHPTQMLYAAARGVRRRGFQLMLIEGYRSLSQQQEAWDNKIKELTVQFPELSKTEIESKVSLLVARPGILSNHRCGGAVDVTLATMNGTFVDVGSMYAGHVKFDVERHRMFSPNVRGLQAEMRDVLREEMTKVGFVYYPGEWWHYCYGDRMWAAYTGSKECFYGPIPIAGDSDFVQIAA